MNDVHTEDAPVAASVQGVALMAPRINLAFQQNAVPIIAELRLHHETERELADVTIAITSAPAVVQPGMLRIERVRAGETHHVSPVDLTLDPGLLVELREATLARITITVTAMAEPVPTLEHDIDMLAPNHRAGLAVAPELVAALVQPNDPGVDTVLRIASARLSAAARLPGIDGYTSLSRCRARQTGWSIGSASCWTSPYFLRQLPEAGEVVARMARDLGPGRIRQPILRRLRDAVRLAGNTPSSSP